MNWYRSHTLKVERPVSDLESRYSDMRSNNSSTVSRFLATVLTLDPVFRASCQIEYNAALISKAETDIKAYETELTSLRGIMINGGDAALGLNEGGFLGVGKHSAIRERARWLLEKMGKNVEKLGVLEKENGEMMKLLGGHGEKGDPVRQQASFHFG